jgi:hypothetical protein
MIVMYNLGELDMVMGGIVGLPANTTTVGAVDMDAPLYPAECKELVNDPELTAVFNSLMATVVSITLAV